jgi:Putative MetA-pathway of phenol degradation
MRRLICALALITAASSAVEAQEVKHDGSYRVLLSAGVGRFTGDYGEPEKTTLDVLSLSARWYFKRAEVQVSVPYLRIDGGADVSFIDGQPVAGGGDSAADSQRNESGLGDVVLRGEYYLRTGTSTSPWIIGLVRVKLPTGSESKGLGSGATDVETGIGLIQRQGRINWLADVGYIFVGSAAGVDAKNELRLGAGASLPFGKDERNNCYVYYENRTNRFSGSDDRRSIAIGVSTALTQAKRVRLSASTFFGLSDSSEDVGIYLTVGRRY